MFLAKSLFVRSLFGVGGEGLFLFQIVGGIADDAPEFLAVGGKDDGGREASHAEFLGEFVVLRGEFFREFRLVREVGVDEDEIIFGEGFEFAFVQRVTLELHAVGAPVRPGEQEQYRQLFFLRRFERGLAVVEPAFGGGRSRRSEERGAAGDPQDTEQPFFHFRHSLALVERCGASAADILMPRRRFFNPRRRKKPEFSGAGGRSVPLDASVVARIVGLFVASAAARPGSDDIVQLFQVVLGVFRTAADVAQNFFVRGDDDGVRHAASSSPDFFSEDIHASCTTFCPHTLLLFIHGQDHQFYYYHEQLQHPYDYTFNNSDSKFINILGHN